MRSAGCGATGDAGGGADAPAGLGRGAVHAARARSVARSINAPFVLADNTADLDDPWVVADGDALALWVTARRDNVHRHRALRLVRARAGFLPLVQAILRRPGVGGGRRLGRVADRRRSGRAGRHLADLLRRRRRDRLGDRARGHARPQVDQGARTGADRQRRRGGRELVVAGGGAARRSRARLLPRRRRHLGRRSAVGRRRRRHAPRPGRGSTAIPARPSAIRCCARRRWALSIGRVTARAGTDARRARAPRSRTSPPITAPTAKQPSISTCGFASSFTGDRFGSPPRRSCRSRPPRARPPRRRTATARCSLSALERSAQRQRRRAASDERVLAPYGMIDAAAVLSSHP